MEEVEKMIEQVQKDLNSIIDSEKAEDPKIDVSAKKPAYLPTRKLKLLKNITNLFGGIVEQTRAQDLLIASQFEKIENYKDEMGKLVKKEIDKKMKEFEGRVTNLIKETVGNELEESKQDIESMRARNSILTDETEVINESLALLEGRVMKMEEENDQAMQDFSHLEGKIENEIGPLIADTSEKCSELLEKIKKTGNTSSTSGQSNPQIKIKNPVFKGQSYEQPLKFLSDCKKYVNTYKTNWDSVITLLNQCLENDAKEWFYLIQNGISDFGEFEHAFKERYWNETIKIAIKKRLEFGTFAQAGKKTRVQYATQLFNYAKDIDQDRSEDDIIKVIARHFEREIKLTAITKSLKIS